MSEQQSGGVVDWNAVDDNYGSKFEGRPKVSYLKIPKGGSARIRMVTQPRWLLKHSFNSPIWAISPGQEDDVAWKEGGHRPSKRHYSYVINRADGAVQIYDFSGAILLTISTWAKLKGKDPTSHDEGIDFIITSTLQKGPDGTRNSYQIMPDEKAPLTDSERAEVARVLEEAPLDKVCAPDSAEHIARLWADYKNDPEGPAPGSPKYWKRKRDEKNAGASANAGGGVKFDDDASDIAAPPPVNSASETSQASTSQNESAGTPDSAATSEPNEGDNFGKLFSDTDGEESGSLF